MIFSRMTPLRGLLTAGAVLVALSPAHAADLGAGPADEASASAAASQANWTGGFAGLDLGIGNQGTEWTYTSNLRQTSHDSRGDVFGFNAGYQRQFGMLVAGVEIDADWANVRGKSDCPNASFFCETRVSGLEAVQGRLGVASGRWLAYGTMGLGLEQVSYAAGYKPDSTFDHLTPTHTLVGLAVGAGVDVKLSKRLSLGLDYQHFNFGSETVTDTVVATGQPGNTYSTSPQNLDLVKLQLTYHFGGDAADHQPLK